MRILHVIDSLARGGAERMLVDLANASAADGHHISVCVTRRATDLATELRQDIVRYVLERDRRFDWAAMRRFSELVRDSHVEVLHAHSRSTLAFLALQRLLGWVRVPIVLHDHFGAIDRDRSVPPWFRWARRYVSVYVGVSESLGTWARGAGVPPASVTVIGNALDVRRLDGPASRRAGDVGDAVPLLGVTIAGMRHDKGIDVLLAAVARAGADREFQIRVVGRAQDAEYMAACRNARRTLGLESRVVFDGEQSDVPATLRGADFAIVPSRSESGPLVLIEALACGLPVVYTSTGGISSRVAALGVPGVVPPGDADALAAAVRELIALPEAARRIRGEQGCAIARQHFDIRAVMPRWYEVYGRARAREAT